jgi:hypothetical protein
MTEPKTIAAIDAYIEREKAKAFATIKRRISAITAAGILKSLYPRRAPTRGVRWICSNVCFQARVERIANRTPAAP